jgi:hypothetical protein
MFFITIYKDKKAKTGYRVRLQAFITQHSKDKLLLERIMSLLGYGEIYNSPSRNITIFSVFNFEDIYGKLIPLFKEYKIRGIKALNFQDFCLAAKLMDKKIHLTEEGLKQIKSIKSGMNKSRNIKIL